MPPPFSTACSWAVSPARITLLPVASARLIRSASSGPLIIDVSSTDSKVPGLIATGPRAPRWPGRWPRNWAVLYDTGMPAARVLRADCDGVMPITGPSPADSQARASSNRTRVLPDPAGALITETRLPSVSADSAAAAWSPRSPVSVQASCAWCASPASACSSRSGSAPRARAASARVRRGAPSARACASMRSSIASCARVAYRTPPCRW